MGLWLEDLRRGDWRWFAGKLIYQNLPKAFPLGFPKDEIFKSDPEGFSPLSIIKN